MSNINTTGFKRTYEVAMKAFKADGQGFDTRFQPQAIHTDLVQLAPGPMITSGRDLDIMMNDSTVMGVTAPNGELAFTRRGDLHLNVNGVLETGANHVIQAEGGWCQSRFLQVLRSRLRTMGKFMPLIQPSLAFNNLL
jgi:flagellar basal-body rod protein FlgF